MPRRFSLSVKPFAAPLLFAGAVLVVSLALAGLAWRGARAAHEDRLRAVFDLRVAEAERLVLERLKDDERVLAGVSGLFAASRDVSRSEFQQYAAALDLPGSLPGIQVVGFQRAVAPDALAEHVAAVRGEGFPDYAIRPEGRRELHAPVVFVEPASPVNLRALGFDPLGEPSRREALERARDTGKVALSGKVTLVQDADARPVPGAVFYLPVYRAGSPPASPEGRRGSIVGWVYVAFRVGDLVRGALGDALPELAVAVFDGETPVADRALDLPGAPLAVNRGAEERLETERLLDVGGRRWVLVARSTDALERRVGTGQAAVAGIAGVAVSVLLAALAFLLAAQRARVQEALRRSESLHRLLMRSFPNGAVALFDRDLRFSLADGTGSPAMKDPRAWTGKTLGDLVPPALRPGLEAAYRRALEGEASTIEVELDGRVAEVHLQPVLDAGRPAKLGVAMIQDVTDRKRAEAALKASEQQLRVQQARLDLAARAGNLGLWDLDLATGEVWRTAEHDRIFGHDEPPARWTQADALRHVAPEDRPKIRKALDEAMTSGKLHLSCRIRDEKGKERWVEADARVLRDESGNPVRIAGSLLDVTERVRADERIRALQERLALTSRLAALGTLVAGVAHEINNPLAAEIASQGLALEVVGTVRERLRGGAPFDPAAKARMLDEAVEALHDAQEAGLRIAGIVKDMAALVSLDPKRTRVRVADVVGESLSRLPASAVPKGAVRVEDLGAPDVVVAAGQIAQVVVNLVTNAARASRAGSDADIRVRIGPGGPGMARLEVIDHGEGIDPGIRDRIFDPFFTTRPAGEGRGKGLGLAICQAIVMTHGGALTVESELGKGSTFRVELPAAPAGA